MNKVKLGWISIVVFVITSYAILSSKSSAQVQPKDEGSELIQQKSTAQLSMGHLSRIVNKNGQNKLFNSIELTNGPSKMDVGVVVFFGGNQVKDLSASVSLSKGVSVDRYLDLEKANWNGETINVVYFLQPYVPSSVKRKGVNKRFSPVGNSFYDFDTIPGEDKEDLPVLNYETVKPVEAHSFVTKSSSRDTIYKNNSGTYQIYFNALSDRKRDYYITCLNEGRQVEMFKRQRLIKLAYAGGKAYIIKDLAMKGYSEGRLQCVNLNLFPAGSKDKEIDYYIYNIESMYIIKSSTEKGG